MEYFIAQCIKNINFAAQNEKIELYFPFYYCLLQKFQIKLLPLG